MNKQLSELDKLKDLLHKMDYIEGTTEGGRYFKITYTDDGLLRPQIFEDGCVYEPSLRISEIIGANILSTINKIESSFFTNSYYLRRLNITRTRRKEIHIAGSNDNDDKFTLDLSIENNWSFGNLYYRGGFNSLTMDNVIPEHIPDDQKHDWLYFHYQKPESWTSVLEFTIKDNWYRCCGQDINGKWNYCHFCGKKQEVSGIVINTITSKELLTKLT